MSWQKFPQNSLLVHLLICWHFPKFADNSLTRRKLFSLIFSLTSLRGSPVSKKKGRKYFYSSGENYFPWLFPWHHHVATLFPKKKFFFKNPYRSDFAIVFSNFVHNNNCTGIISLVQNYIGSSIFWCHRKKISLRRHKFAACYGSVLVIHQDAFCSCVIQPFLLHTVAIQSIKSWVNIEVWKQLQIDLFLY